MKEEIVDALCALSSHPDIRNSLFLKVIIQVLSRAALIERMEKFE